MPFWSKYTDPPTSMICGINFFQMLKNWQAGARAQKNTALPMPWSYQTEHPKHLSQL